MWADLQSREEWPNFAFIVPNQCHDMHGFVSGGTPICSASTPAESAFLIPEGAAEIAKLVNGIEATPYERSSVRVWPIASRRSWSLIGSREAMGRAVKSLMRFSSALKAFLKASDF